MATRVAMAPRANATSKKYQGVRVGVGEDDDAWRVRVWALRACHLLGLIAHGVGLALTLTQGRLQARLSVHVQVPERVYSNGTDGSVGMRASTREIGALYPTLVVVAFFAISFLAHLVVLVAMSSPRGLAWYLSCMRTGVTPVRWIEYAASASVMMLLAARVLGTTNVHVLVAVTVLMATTMFFGYLTEVVASHHAEVQLGRCP